MSKPTGQKTNLAKIAEACGLSKSTVSRALKDSPKIPEATRERVKAMAREMGYQQNRSISRVMSEIRNRKHTEYRETLAYITADEKNYERLIFAGVQRRAEDIGYRVDRFAVKNPKQELPALDRVLRSRGIRGVIIAPFAEPEVAIELSWDRLASVAIGYTMVQPDIHRVERDVLHVMRMAFAKLTARGYKRIGFIIERSHEERMDFCTLAGFLAHDYRNLNVHSAPPLIPDVLTGEAIVEWYERERPDVVFTMDHLTRKWLEQAGHRIPVDVGFFVFNCKTPDSELSGIYPQYEDMGAGAVEQLSGLLERGEFGIPEYPRCLLVRGVWCEGKTIRSDAEAGQLVGS